MIVVEYSTDDYGKLMEYATCIEKKAKCIREIIEEDTMDQRYRSKVLKRRYHDDDYDEEDEYKHRKRMSRYA